jgi:LysM repeat protein
MSAPKTKLEKLHDTLADHFTDILEKGVEKTVNKKTGEVEEVSLSPAILNVIRQFLKDNDVISAAEASNPLKELHNKLPFLSEIAQKNSQKRGDFLSEIREDD